MIQVVPDALILNRLRCLRKKIKGEQGIALPLFAAFLVVFLLCFAFTVDLGKILITRHKIQSIVDAASLAGASQTQVHGIYDASGNPISYNVVVDPTGAQNQANAVIDMNKSNLDLAGQGIVITSQTITEPASNQVYVELDFTVKTILLDKIAQVTPISLVPIKVRATSQIKL